MDRLTTSDWGSIVCGSCTYLWPPNGCLLDDPCPRKLIRDCMKRLGAYEDTGLSPDDVVALQQKIAQRERELESAQPIIKRCTDCPVVCARSEIINAMNEADALRERLAQVERERDQAVKDLRNPGCKSCKYYERKGPGHYVYTGPDCEECMDEEDYPDFVWRGLEGRG